MQLGIDSYINRFKVVFELHLRLLLIQFVSPYILLVKLLNSTICFSCELYEEHLKGILLRRYKPTAITDLPRVRLRLKKWFRHRSSRWHTYFNENKSVQNNNKYHRTRPWKKSHDRRNGETRRVKGEGESASTSGRNLRTMLLQDSAASSWDVY